MKYIVQLVCIGLLCVSSQSFGQCSHKNHRTSSFFSAENMRSDTIDVLHYNIYLKLDNVSNGQLTAWSEVSFTAKLPNVNSLTLDLQELTVDSVVYEQQLLNYTQLDSIVTISFPSALSTSDTESVVVYYRGQPVIDPSGWGGVYYSGGYVFNLGVGFQSKPHNYGRTWHPCFDNFVERVQYSIAIETSASHRGASIGVLTDTTHLSNGNIVWQWDMEEAIPSYLSMFAVSNYEEVKSQHQGLNSLIPISLFARASDTNNLKQSFINLPNAIDAFETGYGPYQFNKVGYTLVPFNGGAMEHASNVTYPRSSANGTLNSETLMAHELAHSWWGNWVTCETPEDMWLNEGWASYSAMLFLESVYGWDRAVEEMNGTLFPVIYRAHIQEGGYLAVSGVPHEITYGTHTYDKGALVAWNLRGYLGDNVFFDGVKTFLNQHAFSTMNSVEFRDDLSQITGVDLTPFFDGWVFNGGYPAVEFNELNVNSSTGDVTIELEQKLKGTSTYFTAMPVEVLITNDQGDSSYQSIEVNGQLASETFNLPFTPTKVVVNPNQKLALAHTQVNHQVSQQGNLSSNEVLMQGLRATNVSTPGDVSVELFWVRPDAIKDYLNLPYRLSQDRYWRVTKSTGSDFSLETNILFDAGQSGSFLDSALLLNYPEDSLVLLHRLGPDDDWLPYPNAQFQDFGNNSDGRGLIEISELNEGEYTLAVKDYTVLGIFNSLDISKEVRVYPNPSSDQTRVTLVNPNEKIKSVKCYTINGSVVYETNNANVNEVVIPKLPSGTYVMRVITDQSEYSVKHVAQ